MADKDPYAHYRRVHTAKVPTTGGPPTRNSPAKTAKPELTVYKFFDKESSAKRSDNQAWRGRYGDESMRKSIERALDAETARLAKKK